MMRRLVLTATLLFLVAVPSARAEVLEELAIPTRDGATIHVEIARPDGAAKVPIVLTYSPYNSLGGTPVTNLASGSEWVEKGYARAVADVVGTRNSTGCWDYGGPIEQRSGVDLVAALSAQPWSNGKVALQGVSYEGTTATMVAAAGDVPGLAAIVPVAAISRWYGYAYQDGVRYLGNSQEPTDEGFDTPLAFDFGFGRTPPDRSAAAQALLDRLNPCDSAEHTLRGYAVDPPYDEFWRERDYLKDADEIDVPAFVVHGWQDYNVKQSEGTNLFEAITNAPFKLAHFHQAPHADGDGDGYDERLEQFLAFTLKGEANGIDQQEPVRTQTRTGTEPGAFQRTSSWPPPGTRTAALAFGPGSTLGGRAASEPITFDDDGTQSEEATIEGRPGSPVLRTAPLPAAVRLAGSAVMRVRVTVNDTAGHLAPTLVDIAPNGSMVPISRGHHNLRFRDGLAVPKPIPAGRPVDATVRLAPQDQTVEAGHRIGLILAGSNVVWAVPAGGRRSLAVDPARSSLQLPVVGDVSSIPGATKPGKPAKAKPKARGRERSVRERRRSGGRCVILRGRCVAPSSR